MHPEMRGFAAALSDRYRLEQLLGSGGMATVHLAHDVKHGRKVAIKVLRPESAAAVGRERFLREIELAARLHHPHILAVFDSGGATVTEAGGRHEILYYVMPHVEGGSLRDRLQREKQLPVGDAVRIARQVADALSYAHSRGVLHRDIKPENILFQSGHALVADFGVARPLAGAAAAAGALLTEAGALVGTPAYMSPEQVGGTAALDGRSDLYSLGCVLYEMLTGDPPHIGASVHKLLARRMSEPAPRVSMRRDTVPDGVETALARVLQTVPADRFATSAEFAEALAVTKAVEVIAPSGAPPPAQLTTFVGREPEIAAVREQLAASRLLTLTGAGGSGKTRLALEVATRSGPQFADGVVWVELAPLLNAELVPGHVADALDVRLDGVRAATDALLDALRGRDLLLVLDNCEHLVDAAARLVDLLLRGCPRLRILATSRETLSVTGERAWLVPALTLPPADQPVTRENAEASEAIRLFVERARAVRPGFDLSDDNVTAVARLCRFLDGLPLAIELAAARARVLEPQQIAARLDDVFRLLTTGSRTALPRHRTLRGAIDWSHALLTELEQVVFRRLSIFAGGFTIDAAEAVASGGPVAVGDVLDLLSGLVDKSLVLLETEAIEARYRILETVRQFGRERLEAAGETAGLAARHAEFFLHRAESAEPFVARHVERWFERLEQDLGNLRAAADWFEAQPDGTEQALRLAAALHWFWFNLGNYREARRRLEVALNHGDRRRTRARGRALYSLTTYLMLQAEAAGVRAIAEESVAILRETADGSEDLLCALVGLGHSWPLEGDLERATVVLDDAVRLARIVSPRFWITYALYWRGRVAQAYGDIATARAAFEEGLTIGLDEGLDPATVHLGTMRGRLAHTEGDAAGAIHWFTVAFPALRRIRNHWSLLVVVEDLARIAVDRAESERSARLLGVAARLREESGAPGLAHERQAVEETTRLARGALDASVFDMAFNAGHALRLPEALDLAETILGERAAPALPAGLPLLSVNALGGLEVSVGGEPIALSAWTYARPRELLLYLLCHPRGRTREQIGLVFWPDASLAQLKNNFHVTLHYLRRTLGRPDWVVFADQRYRINPDLPVELDATQFESAYRAGRSAAASTGSGEILEQALSRYRGDFLETESVGDWHLEHREHWARLYDDGLLALGECHWTAERWAKALDAYRMAVSRDPFHEEAHRRVLQCLGRLGRRAEAMRHYERLIATLRAELDAGPEVRTKAVYEQLAGAS